MDKGSLRIMRTMRGEIEICETGKPAYDKKSALSARNLRKKNGGIKLRVYHCDECNRWHLTKSL